MSAFIFKAIINPIICILIAHCAALSAMHIEVTIGENKDWAFVEKDKLCLFYMKDGKSPDLVTLGEPTTAQQHYLSLAIQAGRKIAQQQNIYTTHWHFEDGSLKQIPNEIKSIVNYSHNKEDHENDY